jgi:mono/diheme cytochrome c family protein
MTRLHPFAALAALCFALVALQVNSSAVAQHHCGPAQLVHRDDAEEWYCPPMWECAPPRHRWRDLRPEPRVAPPRERRDRRPAAAGRDDTPEPPQTRETPARETQTGEAPARDAQTGEAPAREMGPGREHSTARREAAARGEIPQKFMDLRNDVGHTIAAISAGLPLYAQNCASCHGPSGQGDGEQAQSQASPPSSLGHVACQPYASDAYLAWTILQGGIPLNTDKPAFADVLSEAQVWQIIAYMRAGFPAQSAPPSRQMDDEPDDTAPLDSEAAAPEVEATPLITPLAPVAPARL